MSKPGTPLFVNADWSALVPAGSVEAAFGCDVDTARRLGLLDGPKPAEPVTIQSANLVVAEPAEGLEVPLGAVAELSSDGETTSARIVAEAGSPEAEAFLAENGDPEHPVALEASEVKEAPPPADKQAAKPANKAVRKPRRK